MEYAIHLLIDEAQILQQATSMNRAGEYQYDSPPQGNKFDDKEMKRISMSPTEGSTITGTETASEIISTITTASTLSGKEMNGVMKMTRKELQCIERNHTKVMSVMQ